MFTEFRKKKTDRTVSIGERSDLDIVGEGRVNATIVVDGNNCDIVVKDVLFVPKLSCNPISVSRCGRNFVKVIFDFGQDSRSTCTVERFLHVTKDLQRIVE